MRATTDPALITSAPDHNTRALVATTTSPCPTTTAPDPTTSGLAPTTTTPDPSTSAPALTPTAPAPFLLFMLLLQLFLLQLILLLLLVHLLPLLLLHLLLLLLPLLLLVGCPFLHSPPAGRDLPNFGPYAKEKAALVAETKRTEVGPVGWWQSQLFVE